MAIENNAPTDGNDPEMDRKHELSILQRLGIFGVLMAVVWALALVATASLLKSRPDMLAITQINCQTAYPYEYADAVDRLACTVEQLRQNQYVQDAKVENLGFAIDYNAVFLGTIAAFFGALITVMVIFFALKTRREALVEARQSAEDIMDKYECLFENRITEANDLLKRTKENADKTEKWINGIDDQLLNRSADDQTDLTPEQEDRAQIALNKPEPERTAADWRAIAFHHIEKDLHFEASLAFAQEASRHTDLPKIASAHFNAALGLDLAKMKEGAITAYNNLISWGKDMDNPEVQKSVAMAWVNKGVTYTRDIDGRTKDPKAEIATYEALTSWGKDMNNPEVQKLVAMGWFNKGLTYTKDIDGWTKDPEAAIATYEALISWGKDIDDPEVQKQVAMAWVNKGATYTQDIDGWTKDPEAEIASYETLISWGKDMNNPEVQKLVAMAWVNKGATYTQDIDGWTKDPEAAIATYEALISWGKDMNNPEVQKLVAMAWVNKGATYTRDIEGWTKDPEAEIASYETLISWGKDTNDPGVLERVAAAYRNLGHHYLVEFDQPQKALKASERGITLCQQREMTAISSYPHLLEHRAEAMYALEHKADAIKLASEIVAEFSDDEDDDIQLAVTEAREKLAEWQQKKPGI